MLLGILKNGDRTALFTAYRCFHRRQQLCFKTGKEEQGLANNISVPTNPKPSINGEKAHANHVEDATAPDENQYIVLVASTQQSGESSN